MNFKKRVNGSWVDTPFYIHTTSTDTLTTLPVDLYADGNNATVGLVGNMQQTGTPTPQSPIQPQECGDLETTGTKAGQYKTPISLANTTTPVYLGEVETTRRIKKYEMTGQEDITYQSAYSRFFFTRTDAYYTGTVRTTPCICSHYQSIHDGRAIDDIPNESIYVATADNKTAFNIKTTDFTDATDFKSYLAQQYANGTPVTIWYILATSSTGIVNEPIRKIGNYADTVSGITIPVTAGANTLSIGTTLQPSEVTATYKGWHPVSNTHVMQGLLANNPLCGIGTYKDTLNLATGACTRYIKKLVLRGNESFAPYSFENTNGIIVANMLNSNYFRANGKCSHYTVSTSSVKNTLWIGVNNSNLYFVGILTALGIEYSQFASWVAQQYSAGHPVTVWYVLATPTTETITVPSGLSGTEEGYLNQSGTPTPTNPIYPTANEVPMWN